MDFMRRTLEKTIKKRRKKSNSIILLSPSGALFKDDTPVGCIHGWDFTLAVKRIIASQATG